MEVVREDVLYYLVLFAMAVSAGAAIMILHGLMYWQRSNSPSESVTDTAGTTKERNNKQALSEYVTRVCVLLAVAVFATFLLATQAKTIPWDWLYRFLLLVGTAPAVLIWLEPSRNCLQIGKGSAYSHYYGYLRLMQGEHGIQTRLENFMNENKSGLLKDKLDMFYSDAVVALAPVDGRYLTGDDPFKGLKGIGGKLCEVPGFVRMVGGSPRTYGTFHVYEVFSSGTPQQRRYVALDKVAALGTLAKLKKYAPAGLRKPDCEKQMKEMIEKLKKIIAESNELDGQMKLVEYSKKEHVGDAIIANF